MKSRTNADHTGIKAETPMTEKVNIRRLAKMCGLPAEHVRKMCDIFDREVPKSKARVKGQESAQSMSKSQFQRFMVKNGYKNATIVNRLFEVFDSKRDQSLSFEELLSGLAFFEDRPSGSDSFIPGMMDGQEDDAEADDTFLSMVARFFDLDGKQHISKLNIFKVINVLGLPRDTAKHIADAMFELLALHPVMLTYTEFIEAAVADPQLCLTMHKVMLLQGKEQGTPQHKEAIDDLLETTKDWCDRSKAGRLVGVEKKIIDEFKAVPLEEERHLLKKMSEIRNRRTGDEKESAEYYFTTMENIVNKGWEFVEKEEERLTKGIARAFEDVTDDNEGVQVSKLQILRRCKSILDAFKPIPLKVPGGGASPSSPGLDPAQAFVAGLMHED